MTCSLLSDADVQRLINIRHHFQTAQAFALAIQFLDLETNCAEKARLLCQAFEYGRAHRGCRTNNNPFLDAMYIRGEYAVDRDGNNHLQDVFGAITPIVDTLYDWAIAHNSAAYHAPVPKLMEEPLPLLTKSAQILELPVSAATLDLNWRPAA